jgi:hypothetical protein
MVENYLNNQTEIYLNKDSLTIECKDELTVYNINNTYLECDD